MYISFGHFPKTEYESLDSNKRKNKEEEEEEEELTTAPR